MKKVFKYIIPKHDQTELFLPRGSTPLRVNVQGDSACMWVEVNPSTDIERRVFETFFTGQEIPDEFIYIDTFYTADEWGPLVYHTYEKPLS